MKKLLFILTLLISVCSFAQIEDIVPKKPSPQKLVNDYTNTLTDVQKQALEDKLVAYDDSTSNQITVVIIPTTGNYSIEEIGLELGRKWGIGNKDINNGVLLLIAKDDRKMRFEIGYGLEGAIPDVTAKDIIEYSIKPQFKLDNYYRGIDEGINGITKAAEGEYVAPKGYGSSNKGKGMSAWTIIMLVVLLIIIFGGGAAGGVGGTYVSRGGFTGWSGGGSSGGGSGGGGFGGFGGGSFGGGGASGSW